VLQVSSFRKSNHSCFQVLMQMQKKNAEWLLSYYPRKLYLKVSASLGYVLPRRSSGRVINLSTASKGMFSQSSSIKNVCSVVVLLPSQKIHGDHRMPFAFPRRSQELWSVHNAVKPLGLYSRSADTQYFWGFFPS
jgi:hypothetical protein